MEHFPPTKQQLDLENDIKEKNNKLSESPQNEHLKREIEELQRQLESLTKSRCFRVKPKRFHCTFFDDIIHPVERGLFRTLPRDRPKRKVVLIQFPINLNDATTAHKLQGASKQNLIVNNWHYSHGWVYTVLSRVRARIGLFLMKRLEFKSDRFTTPRDLQLFDFRMSQKIPERVRQYIP